MIKLQIIRAHSELELYVGMDVDPIAHERARARIHSLCGDSSHLKAHVFMRNFKNIKSVLREVDEELLSSGVDGILMDLGMSSMQVCFLTQSYCCNVNKIHMPF